MRAELAGPDRLARALVLHALGQAGRSAHREVIAEAAAAEALAASPADLLRRLTAAVDDDLEEGATDMPSRVETLIAAMTEDPGVRLPGERRLANRERAAREGVSVPAELLEKIRGLAGEASAVKASSHE